MCLGVIATVTAIWDEGGMPMAMAEDGQGEKPVCLAYVPDTQVGEHILVHLGFALETLDPGVAATARSARLAAGGTPHEPPSS